MIRISAIAVMLFAGVAHARTIELSDKDCRHMAAIDADAPHLGWAAYGHSGAYHTMYVELTTLGRQGGRAFLIKFPLDRIPEGMRITNAKLVLPVIHVHPRDRRPRVEVRRIMGAWGAGVCHEYRMQIPEKVKWTAPGAMMPGKDRARRPTAAVRVSDNGDLEFNVTQDVELFAVGAVENNGWIITIDDEHALVRFDSPTWSPGRWKLLVTFEPR